MNLAIHLAVWTFFATFLWAFYLDFLPYNWRVKARAPNQRTQSQVIHGHMTDPNQPNH